MPGPPQQPTLQALRTLPDSGLEAGAHRSKNFKQRRIQQPASNTEIRTLPPLQVNARLQAHGIETIYPDLHIGSLVHASTRLAYLAMMEMAEALHDPELRDGIHELFLSIYPTPHVTVGRS